MANKFLIICGGSGVGLLGQRKILGVSGELDVDVRREVNDNLPINDERSLIVKLDMAREAGTAKRLLHHTREQVQNLSGNNQTYKRHTEYLAQYWTQDSPLEDGLARSPAVGAATIRHEQNVAELNAKLLKMIDEWTVGVGADTPVVFWIVSSCAGGTGEGIHRFVGESIVEIFSTRPAARVRLNFIRIGPGTYRMIDEVRTSLNAFMGIAGDAAFKVKIPRAYPKVNVTTNWFYLEVPPVGVGSAAKPIRAKLIEMASKALMLEELQGDINTIVNNDGIGLVRVGYWGKDFNEDARYYQTLLQLTKGLSEFINPNQYAKYVAGKDEPEFSSDVMEKIKETLNNAELLLHKMQSESWQFPKYTATGTLKPEEIMRMVPQWKNAIDQLIAPERLDRVQPEFLLAQRVRKEGSEETETRRLPLQVPTASGTQFSKEWFGRIETAQQVEAWADYLLGTDQRPGLWASLVELGKVCSKDQHPPALESLNLNIQQKANKLRNSLWSFTETLVKVLRLTELRSEARVYLSSELEGARNVLMAAEKQLPIAEAAAKRKEAAPVIAADLSDRLGQLTEESWLRILHDAVKRTDDKLFRSEVLKGATGLERDGLLAVLSLPTTVTADEIRATLREKMGRMVDADNTPYEAQWWSGSRPPGILREFNYRILPKLGLKVRAELGDSDKEIKYLYTGLGVIGLNVLAFEGVTIATSQDTITTPAYLMAGFVEKVKKHLDDWNDKPVGVPSPKLNLLSAGVGSEPLYKPALVKAGLGIPHLDKLDDYFDLYQPEEERKKKAPKKGK